MKVDCKEVLKFLGDSKNVVEESADDWDIEGLFKDIENNQKNEVAEPQVTVFEFPMREDFSTVSDDGDVAFKVVRNAIFKTASKEAIDYHKAVLFFLTEISKGKYGILKKSMLPSFTVDSSNYRGFLSIRVIFKGTDERFILKTWQNILVDAIYAKFDDKQLGIEQNKARQTVTRYRYTNNTFRDTEKSGIVFGDHMNMLVKVKD